jgi:GH15 family glucan-1,4-alpha-glucosidase
MSKPLEDYGLIGNMLSAALVARDGSIDWLCLPHFDSPACFAALLGDERHGRWRIAPHAQRCTVSRRYVPDTAVLETRYETGSGTALLYDFMPLSDDDERADVVRIVRGESGHVQMDMEMALRFNYGQAVPWVRRRDYGLSAIAGPDAVELHTPVDLAGHELTTTARFTVHPGRVVPFTLSYHRSHRTPHFVPDRVESMDRTISWWQEWAKRCRWEGSEEGREAVVRSLITLKLLTFQPTGGIIAAPTTSLPEALGGSRNWDYRHCWLRDSALTLYALLNAGYREEAEAWRLQNVLLEPLKRRWQDLDHGIWEVRGERRAFTHSRLMCWVAFDRAVQSCDRFGLRGPRDEWQRLADRIRADICKHGYNQARGSFVQSYGSDELDASLLLIPQVGFLPADDPRVAGTVRAIERELLRDGLLLRYSNQHASDGLPGDEGVFLACSFWLADAYVMQGRIDDAERLFERLLALRNDLGLLAEEYDVGRRRLVGNFPQGFSHIGLVNTAYNLSRASGPARQRSEQDAPRE